MIQTFHITKKIGCLLGILLLIASCDVGKNDPGYAYFPDMAYSNAYETYSENPVFENNATMREPVKGTIPRWIVPFQYEKSDEDMIRAGLELENPLAPSETHIARGEEMYKIMCNSCHGDEGKGKGFLYTSGKYPYPPATLVSEKMINKPDGEIYHSISVGFGVMGAHAPLIRPEDRWKIIHYIRKELQSNNQK